MQMEVDFPRTWEHISGDIVGQTQVSYARNLSSDLLTLNHPLDLHFAEAGMAVRVYCVFVY